MAPIGPVFAVCWNVAIRPSRPIAVSRPPVTNAAGLRLKAVGRGAYAPDAEVVTFIVQLELPRSAGEIVIESPDATIPPRIDMNYYADPVDLKVMAAAMRRSLEVAAKWPGPGKLGPWTAPPELSRKHGHVPGERPSDALLENTALHFSHTTYHVSCTCRIGSVVDPRLVTVRSDRSYDGWD